jgi:CRP/FNR family cyclic AMP-dependent transcriptional regulator
MNATLRKGLHKIRDFLTRRNARTPMSPTQTGNDGLSLLPPALRNMALMGMERRFRKGSILIQEGEPGGTLFFIVSGQLRAYSTGVNGQEFTFGYYGPGEYMGEMSLDGEPRSASVIVESAVVCRIVTRAVLEQCIAQDPSITFLLMAKVIRLVRALSLRARDLALNDAYGRLVKLLRDEALLQPDGSHWMPHTLTQEQLAQQVGCSRTMITKLLGDLVKGGYMHQDEKRWRLMRPLPPKW